MSSSAKDKKEKCAFDKLKPPSPNQTSLTQLWPKKSEMLAGSDVDDEVNVDTAEDASNVSIDYFVLYTVFKYIYIISISFIILLCNCNRFFCSKLKIFITIILRQLIQLSIF
jgi:hypothetical protein